MAEKIYVGYISQGKRYTKLWSTFWRSGVENILSICDFISPNNDYYLYPETMTPTDGITLEMCGITN